MWWVVRCEFQRRAYRGRGCSHDRMHVAASAKAGTYERGFVRRSASRKDMRDGMHVLMIEIRLVKFSHSCQRPKANPCAPGNVQRPTIAGLRISLRPRTGAIALPGSSWNTCQCKGMPRTYPCQHCEAHRCRYRRRCVVCGRMVCPGCRPECCLARDAAWGEHRYNVCATCWADRSRRAWRACAKELRQELELISNSGF